MKRIALLVFVSFAGASSENVTKEDVMQDIDRAAYYYYSYPYKKLGEQWENNRVTNSGMGQHLYGGAYSLYNGGCQTANAATASCSCPIGYSSTRMTTWGGNDIVTCYKKG